MIKAKDNKSVEKKDFTVQISGGAEKLFIENSDPELRKRIDEIEECKNVIKDRQEEISYFRKEIRYFYEKIHSSSNDITFKKQRLYLLENEKRELEKNPSKNSEKIKEELEKIKSLPFINSIRKSGENVVLKTNAVFSNIRTYGGSREKVRRCIGAYEISFKNNDYTTLKIKNLVFTSRCGHWAINDSYKPCLEEHATPLKQSLENNNLYDFVLALQYFLVSDNDSGAYLTSNDWIEYRDDNYDGYVLDNEININDFVYIAISHEVYKTAGDFQVSDEDRYGFISDIINDNYFVVTFEKPVTIKTGETGNSITITHDLRGKAKPNSFVFPKQNLRKVTETEYSSKTLEPLINKMSLIDDLPVGSTTEDIKNILTK